MNAFLTLFAVSVLSGAALIAIDPALAHRLGRWLIAWAYARRAAKAVFERCFSIWRQKEEERA